VTTRTLTLGSYGLPAGAWRWAALGFIILALAAAGLAVGAPDAARWAGVALLGGIGAVACLFLYAVWPRESVRAGEARLIAEAAARANVAWAVIGADGAVADCNDIYRGMAGVADGDVPPPPELALGSEGSAATLYRLARSAEEGKAREEIFAFAPGLEVAAAVRPLSNGSSAWWFAPRLVTVAPAAPVEARASAPATPQVAPTAFFRDAPVGVAIADGMGRVLEANTAFGEFLSGSVGHTIGELIEAADAPAVADLLLKVKDGAHGIAAVDVRPAGKSDRMAELYASAANGSGNVILYLVDVTEQKVLETKFAQSQKMQAVGKLAGGVAHDFNNLLTVIIGFSDLLLMRHTAGDPSFNEINEIRQNGLRAANLVRQLLAFSREQTMQPKVLALNDALTELGQLLRRLVGESVTVKMENPTDLWLVHADESQITNAVINLVVNARDAMPRGGTVTIRSSNESVTGDMALGTAIMPAGDYVRIDVIDEGTGIAKEHIGKIFDPFFTTKPVGQGTGLGLATVYGIVKQTGGYITVDSDVGKGTTFRIYLPRFFGEAPAPAAEAPPARDMTGQDTILLVEDEDAVRAFAARALRVRGYNVLEAPGGEEALEIAQKHDGAIHLVISDVVMPNMDGPTMVRALKRIRPETAVIFMSGYAEEAFRRNDENAADLHFLPKPFGLKQLAAKVKDVLSAAPAAKK
jgi:signal transduction histidine kinase/ActR/RegA family two-component response regulator